VVVIPEVPRERWARDDIAICPSFKRKDFGRSAVNAIMLSEDWNDSVTEKHVGSSRTSIRIAIPQNGACKDGQSFEIKSRFRNNPETEENY
jgi:hypothetical protein